MHQVLKYWISIEESIKNYAAYLTIQHPHCYFFWTDGFDSALVLWEDDWWTGEDLHNITILRAYAYGNGRRFGRRLACFEMHKVLIDSTYLKKGSKNDYKFGGSQENSPRWKKNPLWLLLHNIDRPFRAGKVFFLFFFVHLPAGTPIYHPSRPKWEQQREVFFNSYF